MAACALTLSAAPGPAAATVSVSGPIAPACSWSERGYRYDNSAYPETAARYWIMRFKKQAGLTIRVNGQYPEARYSSLNVYDSTSSSFTTDGVSSGLVDHRIDPDPGSTNPWRQKAAPGGHFTVRVIDASAAGKRNTLPLAPAGTAELTDGSLIFRTYLDSAPVQLPDVTFEKDGRNVAVPLCSDAQAPQTAERPAPATDRVRAMETGSARPAGTSGAAPVVEFSRKSGAGQYPNADAAYLSARFTPPPAGQVLVVRGKAPVALRGGHPQPWPTRRADVRFWSLCDNVVTPPGPVVVNPLPGGGVDTGCRNDEQIEVAQGGTYTFVVGTEAQRAAVDRIPGATFVPVSAAHPNLTHLLVLRQLIAAEHFRGAIQNVPLDSQPADAQRLMGSYYPQASYCSLDSLLHKRHGRTCAPAH
ncbi:hypothetical protein [Streptomyces sp. SID14478]|uniref:hypothetical protein n=1 Tax=Streptomyces sp. SID14478 TaxID=2706073 RepID=UPI0013E0E7BD|nr:hypothetical protein [Streptomyces sp. SID14478]